MKGFPDHQQAQTYNTSIFSNTTGTFTFQDAYNEDLNSALMLNEVVDYFIDQGYTTIYIMAHSFGCWVTQLWMQEYGIPEQVSGIAIMNGRLDMPDVVWEGFAQGYVYLFDSTTQVPYKAGDVNELPDGEAKNFLIDKCWLQAAAGQVRFTQTLDDLDLSKVVYVYSTQDMAVGGLSEQEINFLNSHGSTVIGIQDGDHGTVATGNWPTVVYNALLAI